VQDDYATAVFANRDKVIAIAKRDLEKAGEKPIAYAIATKVTRSTINHSRQNTVSLVADLTRIWVAVCVSRSFWIGPQ
jgi:hypothetical protein